MTGRPARHIKLRKRPIAKKTVSVSKYNAVVDSAEIVHIALVHMNFELHPQALRLSHSELEFSYDGRVTQQDVGADGTASAVFSWSVSAVRRVATPESSSAPSEGTAGGDQPELLSVNADWLAIFTGVSNQQEEAVKAYMERVGRMATYPYFRSLVSQMSWASGANLPLMPIVRP